MSFPSSSPHLHFCYIPLKENGSTQEEDQNRFLDLQHSADKLIYLYLKLVCWGFLVFLLQSREVRNSFSFLIMLDCLNKTFWGVVEDVTEVKVAVTCF